MTNTAKIGGASFSVGDTVKVFYKIIEKEKVSGVKKREEKEEVRQRFQPFEGVVIAINTSGNFIVRRIGVDGVGIERIFPLSSPWIQKIVVSQKGDVRRAKLYYLRKTQQKL